MMSEEEYTKRCKESKELRTTRTVFTRAPGSQSPTFRENVIKELTRGGIANANVSKSTLIIHAVQRVSVLFSTDIKRDYSLTSSISLYR